MIDSMAVAAVIDPSLVETIPARVGVETKGDITLGQTVADFRHSHVWHHLPVISVGARADYRRFLDLTLASVGVQP
jgi:purine nucleosidase/pyrimidine-specific ribonucleoside hydrolase